MIPRRSSLALLALVAVMSSAAASLAGCSTSVEPMAGSATGAASETRAPSLQPIDDEDLSAVRGIVSTHEIVGEEDRAIGLVIALVREDTPDGLEVAVTVADRVWLLPRGLSRLVRVENVGERAVRIVALKAGETVP